MPKMNELIVKKIREKYWPRIDAAGKRLKPNSDGTWKGVEGDLDPDVVWIGPLLHGMVLLGVFRNLRQAKTFFFETGAKGDKFEFLYERAKTVAGEWPYSEAKYDKPITLVHISGTGLSAGGIEPGDIKNSPKFNLKTEDIWEMHPEMADWDIELLLDKRHGLHQLNRGDKVTKKWYYTASKQVVTEVYVLRPVTEGPSFVPQADERRMKTIA